MEPIDFLVQHPPFDRLSKGERERVKNALDTVRFAPGESILAQGGPPSRHLYVIRSGAAQLSRDGDVVQLLEEGEPFGERSLLSGEPPPFDVVAGEETVAYRIPEDVFRPLLSNRAFAEFFVAGLGERLRRTRQRERARAGDLAAPISRLVARAPVLVAPDTSVAAAARTMTEEETSSVIVGGGETGIVTDGDLRRRVLARGVEATTPVRDVMSRPLKTVRADLPTYTALLRMLEEDVHHLAVTADERIVGVVTDRDLLRHQAKSPFYLLRRVESAERSEELSWYADEVARTAETLLDGGVEAVRIGRVVATLNDALTGRLLTLAERELGPPPCPYAWLALGSEGRMEQVLLTDQDNALVYAEDTSEASEYFGPLAERVVAGLVAAGFPRCPGGYMATSWRRPLAAWHELVARWLRTPDEAALLDAVIFLDFRPVHGALPVDALDALVLSAPERGFFLSHLARTALAFRPPLDRFRRLRNESGEVDVKRGGIVPIANIARVYALEAGARARPTLERLVAAKQGGVLSRDGAETLAESFRFLMRLRLREQLRRLRAGEEPTNRVRLDALSHLEVRYLKEAFRAILEMQKATAFRFKVER
jgi:CBS domain-containing protein